MTDVQPTFQPSTVSDLLALAGQELGATEWQEVTQAKVNAFAESTGDHQWIHTDPARAMTSPYGSTIAHGLYTLSLGPALSELLLPSGGFARSVNYGYNKVRFPAPLPTGTRVRLRADVLTVDDLGDGCAHVVSRHTFEREESDKPVCVADSVARYYQD